MFRSPVKRQLWLTLTLKVDDNCGIYGYPHSTELFPKDLVYAWKRMVLRLDTTMNLVPNSICVVERYMHSNV